MFAKQYLQTATHLIEQYALQQPLALYLKAYFKHNKHFGSRDRRYIADLVYQYYRLGPQTSGRASQQLILLAALSSDKFPLSFFEKLAPELCHYLPLPAAKRRKVLAQEYGLRYTMDLAYSHALTAQEYQEYLWGQPQVFIRFSPEHFSLIKQRLGFHKIAHQVHSNACISMERESKLSEILPANLYRIQDISSQKTGLYFEPHKKERWWDCCAASGGKSLLLLDKNVPIELTVSDVRPQILHALEERLARYGYSKSYTPLCLDLTKPLPESLGLFDQIICDAPCSGSGTWARSPEQYYFFSAEKRAYFQHLQLQLSSNVAQRLKPGGTMYYITCSALKDENEAVVDMLCEQHGLRCVQQELINHSQVGGDILYMAVLKRFLLNAL